MTTVELIEINELYLHFVVGGVGGLETKIKYGDLISHGVNPTLLGINFSDLRWF